MGQLLDFIKTHDPNTAYEEAQKLIKERNIPQDELNSIIDKAKSLLGMLGMK